ncbi:two-pore potassium channel 3-like [Carica papaya]|uniref:two-pore potassium channel 3-like n=1 Tax=Carica papaya TaxID=3649 RepID=UPI000B8CA467|nr:two-pore potassium channel 3-like [Carica papaya]
MAGRLNMDDPLLHEKITQEENDFTKNSIKRESPFDPAGPSRPQSTGNLLATEANNISKASYINLTDNLKDRKRSLIRSYSAPPIFTDLKEAFSDSLEARYPIKSTPSVVRQAIIGVIVYAIAGVLVYLSSGSFKGRTTLKPVDALYFTVVTLCTIGYGDIVPDTSFTKIFTCIFILVGFGFVDILLNGLVTYICDKQEAIVLSLADENELNTMVQTYVIDKRKGRMRIRIKVGLALGVVVCCIVTGTIAVHLFENLNWVDSFYLSVTSVTTVGYGDYTFTTLTGRCFAVVWLLVSTLAVARAFLYLAELRIHKRNRRIAKWVLSKKMTIRDFVAADLDHDGSISKPEFVIYKLKEMGKIEEKDILQISNQFDLLDNSRCGRLTVAHLTDV